MSPKPNVSEERKKQILEAASDEFAKKGFAKTRMDDIAAKAGLSKGTLYLYFKSKDAIITSLLDHLFKYEMRDLDENCNGLTSEECLMEFFTSLSQRLQNWWRFIPVTYEFLGLIFRNKLVQQSFRRYLKTYVAMVVPVIQNGIRNGEFQDVDPKETALALGAIFEGSILLWVYDSSAVDLESQILSGIRLVLAGMKTDGVEKPEKDISKTRSENEAETGSMP